MFWVPKLKIRVEEFIFHGQKYIINVHVDISFYAMREKLLTNMSIANNIILKRKAYTNFTKIEDENNSPSCYPSAEQQIKHLLSLIT